MKFINKLTRRLDFINSHLCVGLDSQYDLLPFFIRKNNSVSRAIFEFNKNIIEATSSISIVYKINIAFYEGFGLEGLQALEATTRYLHKNFREIPLFADCKRAEMGNSVLMLKKYIFDWLSFDCIMLTPWFGYDSIKDLIKDTTHGILIYVHDSNPSAAELQDLKLKNGTALYEDVALRIVNKWNKNGNIIVEAGATYPKQLKNVRRIVGDNMPIFTAGIVNQGAPVENLKGVFGWNNKRLIVNSSRGIIFAGKDKLNYFKDVKKAAENLRDQIMNVSLQ